MKKLIFIASMVFAVSANAFAQETANVENKKSVAKAKPPAAVLEREKFDPLRNPKADLQAAVEKARKENKRIILDVGGEWCGWCILMDKYFAAHADLKKLRDENFLWLKVNFSPENENPEFLAAYPPASGYPHLYVLDADGAFLHSQDTAELEEGKSYNLQKFTDFLTRWSPVKKTAADKNPK